MQQSFGNQSEVAALREQIAREHEAAQWAASGLSSGTARHRFITRRMERIGVHHQRLSALIGEQASIEAVIQAMEGSPSQRS